MILDRFPNMAVDLFEYRSMIKAYIDILDEKKHNK
jgi:hypothetical protein